MRIHWTTGEGFQPGAVVHHDCSNKRIYHCPVGNLISDWSPSKYKSEQVLPITWAGCDLVGQTLRDRGMDYVSKSSIPR